MSPEGNPKGYSDEQIEEFEKKRIQSSDEAHEMANMIRTEAGENATVADYDEALVLLDEFQEEAKDESYSPGFLAKLSEASSAGRLLVKALLSAERSDYPGLPHDSPSARKFLEDWKKEAQESVEKQTEPRS